MSHCDTPLFIIFTVHYPLYFYYIDWSSPLPVNSQPHPPVIWQSDHWARHWTLLGAPGGPGGLLFHTQPWFNAENYALCILQHIYLKIVTYFWVRQDWDQFYFGFSLQKMKALTLANATNVRLKVNEPVRSIVVCVCERKITTHVFISDR